VGSVYPQSQTGSYMVSLIYFLRVIEGETAFTKVEKSSIKVSKSMQHFLAQKTRSIFRCILL